MPNLNTDRSGARKLIPRFKDERKWPNPAASAGPLIESYGRQHCWEAIGPARKAFFKLAEEINVYLDRCEDSVSSAVIWSLCMTGGSRETSYPTVTFCSSSKEARHRVRKSIKSSGILHAYQGFITMECSRPPGSEMVSLLGGAPARLDQSSKQSPHTIIFHSVANGISGSRLSIYGPDDSSQTQQTATAGGVLKWQGRYFITSTAHSFSENSMDVFEDVGSSKDLELDVDSTSETDDDDEKMIDATSGASQSPGASISDSSILNSTEESPSSSSSISQTIGIPLSSLNGCNTSNQSRSSSPQLHQPPSPRFASSDGTSSEPFIPDIIPLEGPFALSTDGPHSSLDYSLIEITGSDIDKTNNLRTYVHCIKRKIGTRAVAQEPASRKILAATASHGPVAGTLIGTPSFIHLRCFAHQQELWTVQMDGQIEKGDCGSWVIDASNGEVYGHLIAGSPGSGFAYIVPMRQIMEDLHRRFGGDWKIANDETPTRKVSGYDDSSGQISRPTSPQLNTALENTQSIYDGSVVHHFLESLDRPGNYCLGTSGFSLEVKHPFVPFPVLESEMTKQGTLKRILVHIFENDELVVDIEKIREKYIRVFSILLKIGRGVDILFFSRDECLCDDYLPFQSQNTRVFSILGDQALFDRFIKAQWAFCVPALCQSTHSMFDSSCILPIIAADIIEGVGWEIEIHEAYDMLSQHPDRPRGDGTFLPLGPGSPPTYSGMNHAVQDQRRRNNHVYLLKRYVSSDSDDEKHYKREIAAFDLFKNSTSSEPLIVQFYGSFDQAGTHNLLLEYPEQGTLEELFQLREPPALELDKYELWNEMLNILAALKLIHNFGDEASSLETEVFSVSHLDLKPGNILAFSKDDDLRPSIQFKLSGFSLSQFKKRSDSHAILTDRSAVVDHAYEAPRLYELNLRKLTRFRPITAGIFQMIDIWSLCCILSEFAVWITWGRERLADYRRSRTSDGSFHVGDTVLPTVVQHHSTLLSELMSRGENGSDAITAQVVRSLLDIMLWTPAERPLASEAYWLMSTILSKAKTKRDIDPKSEDVVPSYLPDFDTKRPIAPEGIASTSKSQFSPGKYANSAGKSGQLSGDQLTVGWIAKMRKRVRDHIRPNRGGWITRQRKIAK